MDFGSMDLMIYNFYLNLKYSQEGQKSVNHMTKGTIFSLQIAYHS